MCADIEQYKQRCFGSTTLCGQYLEWQWTEKLLDALGKVLTPWLRGTDPVLPTRSSAHYFELIDEVERLYLNGNLANPPSIPELTKAIGIPKRSLYHSFKTVLGMGPHQYLTLIRLHKLRMLLLNADPKKQTVTQLASSMGFEQLGRLSGIYSILLLRKPQRHLKKKIWWSEEMPGSE